SSFFPSSRCLLYDYTGPMGIWRRALWKIRRIQASPSSSWRIWIWWTLRWTRRILWRTQRRIRPWTSHWTSAWSIMSKCLK
ncbi:hypothetical protein PFISCL1PPCAC_1813, partial [Pristionchus fissidentatus]